MSTFLSALERHLESWAEEKKETLEIAEIGHKAPKTKLGRQYGPLHDKMRKKSATIALKILYYLPHLTILFLSLWKQNWNRKSWIEINN